MQLILDFSLSDSRVALNKVLTEMKKELTFEIHESIAKYERSKETETGKAHYLVEADGVVTTAVEFITGKLKKILEYPHRVPFLCYESIEEVLALINHGFTSAALSLDEIATVNINEVYVSVPREEDEGQNIFEVVGFSDLFDTDSLLAMDSIVKQASSKVVQICRNELAYNMECLQKVSG